MADAWGGSWGAAWGAAWGFITGAGRPGKPSVSVRQGLSSTCSPTMRATVIAQRVGLSSARFHAQVAPGMRAAPGGGARAYAESGLCSVAIRSVSATATSGLRATVSDTRRVSISATSSAMVS